MSGQLPPKKEREAIVRIALDVPRAAHLDAVEPADLTFDYRTSIVASPGQRVIVPWGRRELVGLVVAEVQQSSLAEERIRPIVALLDDVSALSPAWFQLVRFAAQYYQRPLGEVALPALPSLLRRPSGYRLSEGAYRSRSMTGLQKKLKALLPGEACAGEPAPILSAEQASAAEVICSVVTDEGRFAPYLLHGVTGSGKTEVYLAAIAAALARGRQVLVLVPEINLTPQLEQVFRARFASAVVAILNSGMADGARAVNWLAAHEGQADILLGTRMAVLASLPRLGLIIVDEEHDPSFKQQEGLRYSARDLAVVRAQQAAIPIVLGSATPSLESWSQALRGRYVKLVLAKRAQEDARLPAIRLIDTRRAKLEHGFSEPLRTAIAARLERGEQSLVFLNRRGYAPVLSCPACTWISDCRRCSAHAVFHRPDGLMHCHHCGWSARVPRACPECGNQDLAPLGRGTQRVEETLANWFPQARLARIDRDSTRRQGSAQTMFEAVHAGEVDILVGTQMVAKGHDFRNLTLVGVVDADTALFSQDFRAGERLFANLMQVAGRAGRADKPGEVLIQTRFPHHELFTALVAHDFERFAQQQLAERKGAGLPPFAHHALLRAEATSLAQALGFLEQARSCALARAEEFGITVYDAVPMALMRLANLERAQLLIESSARPALQAFLAQWMAQLHALHSRLAWHVEVDPLDI